LGAGGESLKSLLEAVGLLEESLLCELKETLFEELSLLNIFVVFGLSVSFVVSAPTQFKWAKKKQVKQKKKENPFCLESPFTRLSL